MRFTLVLFWLALLVWFAAAAAPGATAVAAFTTIPRLGVAVPALEPYFQGDTGEAGRYVAGRMLQPLFDATDWVQMASAALAVSMALRLWRLGGLKGPRWLGVTAVCIVLAAAALLAVRLSLANGLRANLSAYWTGIAQHDRPAATDARLLFDADHRVAERLSSTQLALLLAGAAALAAAMAPAREPEGFRS